MSLTTAGARPPSRLSTEQLEPSEASHRPKEGTACLLFIITPEQREGVNSPLPATEAGPLPKLSTEQLKKPETLHLLAYNQ